MNLSAICVPKTYCNPLALPSYQRGVACSKDSYSGTDFREMADPAVLYFEHRWYLFPSAGMLWHSDDMVDWKFHPIEPFAPGYAPAVAVKGSWIYLSFSWDASEIWRARHPFGPWDRLGKQGCDEDGNRTFLRDHNDRPVRWGDPCLFVDDDQSMYCYCNLARHKRQDEDCPWKLCSDEGAIFGVRLCDDDPSRFAEQPVKLLTFDPDIIWERRGEFNQSSSHPVIEGAWMNKLAGRYYLQYSANCTEFRNYAVGCAVSDSPLGNFARQKHNPVLIHKGGLINGCGHHSIVEGPEKTLWSFYTTLLGINHRYERRIGMDPAGLDANGELFISGPTETPQIAPGLVEHPETGNGLNLLPLSVNCLVSASSHGEGRNPEYAIDNSIRTWWQAADSSKPQWLELDLEDDYLVHSARIIFGDVGLNYKRSILPVPYLYRILASPDGKKWEILCDKTGNKDEKHIVYDTFPLNGPFRFIRLEIIQAPAGMEIAVIEFTIFGLPKN